MKRELSLFQIAGKRINASSLETTCGAMFETIRLDFDDDTFIEILTPTRSKITETAKTDLFNSILKKNDNSRQS